MDLLEEDLLLDLELDFELVDFELVEVPDFVPELELPDFELLEVLEVLEVDVLLGVETLVVLVARFGLVLLPPIVIPLSAYAVSDQTEQVKIRVSTKMK